MSETMPPPFVMASSSGTAPVVPVKLGRLLLSLVLVAAAFDICCWGNAWPGLSVAVFFLVLIAVIVANRDKLVWRRTTRCLVALSAGAALATALEIGITNWLVWLILVTAWAGETFFTEVESVWGRVLSELVALVRAPGRIFWLVGSILDAVFQKGMAGFGGWIGGILLAMPALVLAVIFGSLLAEGNAVFGSWADRFFNGLWQELVRCLNPWRITLWFFVAFLALPLLRPVSVSAWWWSWMERLPRLPELVPAKAALLSSGMVLAVLNGLFFIANLADALFLWSGEALPKGVTYSGYVHEGVNALIATVLLSALVLAAIFQQEEKVARRGILKWLGMLWIGQNLFLIVSMVLRLKLYIEAYDMTITRLSVMIFLALVTVGYGLLAIKMMWERSLSWLVGGCVLAVFLTFYVTQFLDLAGWTATYNVAQWERDRSRSLDVIYLRHLGPAAWPAVRHAQEIDPSIPDLQDAVTSLNYDLRYETEWTGEHWREFSLRAWLIRQAHGATDK